MLRRIRLLSTTLAGLFLALPSATSAAPKAAAKAAPPAYDLKEGDLVFQDTPGPQGEAVRAATGSPYTHCGIVIGHRGGLAVLEAVQPVRITPLERFVSRSTPGSYRAMRLIKTPAAAELAKGRAWLEKQIGVNYDPHFRWDDTRLYCSELVWKAYEKAGVRICEPRALRSYRLDAPAVRKIIRERYGSIGNLPLDEAAVAPGDLASSPLLIEVPRIARGKKAR